MEVVGAMQRMPKTQPRSQFRETTEGGNPTPEFDSAQSPLPQLSSSMSPISKYTIRGSKFSADLTRILFFAYLARYKRLEDAGNLVCQK